MPEKRGVQATEEVKAEWSTAYKFYLRAPGDRFDKKKDRTARIDYVAQEMKLTRKQAKREVNKARHNGSSKPSPKRSRATLRALRREGRKAASASSLARHAHRSAMKKSAAERRATAKKAAQTRRANARKGSHANQ